MMWETQQVLLMASMSVSVKVAMTVGMTGRNEVDPWAGS